MGVISIKNIIDTLILLLMYKKFAQNNKHHNEILFQEQTGILTIQYLH